jgi:hypothetical protein
MCYYALMSVDSIVEQQVRDLQQQGALIVEPRKPIQRDRWDKASRTEIKEISQAEIAWLAGLLEGEGCFMSVPSQRHYPLIVITMTDQDIMQRVADMFEVRLWEVDPVKYQPLKLDGTPRKTQWKATIGGVRAAKWMRVVYPWMGERRRARIDEVIALSPQAAKYGIT